MNKPRVFITEQFIANIRAEGKLAKALKRLSPDLAKYNPLPLLSTWSIVCEEILDTEQEPVFYERFAAELKRRDLNDEEIDNMRVFAWRTAGWLNYEKMVWEWGKLDEKDIRKALYWQVEDGEITDEERKESLKYLAKYE